MQYPPHIERDHKRGELRVQATLLTAYIYFISSYNRSHLRILPCNHRRLQLI